MANQRKNYALKTILKEIKEEKVSNECFPLYLCLLIFTIIQAAGFLGAGGTAFSINKPAFGSTAPAFGATTTSAFGGGGFGSTAGAPAFGGATNSGFGGAFGATGTGGFGNNATSNTGFGSLTTPAFGAQQQNTGFGATNSLGASTGFGTTGFGTSTGSFGNSNSQNQSSGFGSSGNTGFGATGSLGGGLGIPATTGFSSFGASNATGNQGLAFGSSNPTNAFGTTNVFGSPSSNAFGTQQQQQPAFGSNATLGGFGSGTTGGFGQQNGAFSTGGVGFGTSANTGFGTGTGTGFGTGSSTGFGTGTGFGSGTGTGFGSGTGTGFGATNTNPSATFTGFGSPQKSSGFGTTGQTQNLFTTAPSTGISGFGNTTGGNAFGSNLGTGFGGFSQNANQNNSLASNAFATGNNFGLSGFNNNNPSSQFGLGSLSNTSNSNQLAFGGFGQANNTQSGMLLNQMQAQGSMQQVQAPVADISGKLDFLVKKKENLTQAGKTGEATPEPKPAANLFSGFASSKSLTPSYKPSARSSARIIPRDVRTISPMVFTPSKTKLSTEVIDVVVKYTPDSLSLNRSAKKLILSSSIKSPIPDPTEHLPPPPRTVTKTLNNTPSRIDDLKVSKNDTAKQIPGTTSTGAAAAAKVMNFTLSDSAAEEEKGHSNMADGDATGLTPLPTESPYIPNTRSFIRNNKGLDSSSMSDYPRPINFGFSPDGNDRLHTTTDYNMSFREDSCEPPKLERPGYFTIPDMSVLQKMSSAELSSIRSFCVYKPNVGRIQWEGITDVRGLDLDKIVRIEKKEVFVYENDTSPAVGTELNKDAIITLYAVYPKEGSSENKKIQYVQKLKDFCQMNDAEFIDYSLQSGEWVFSVKHFSRYGIDDSDDEEEEESKKDASVDEVNDSRISQNGTNKTSENDFEGAEMGIDEEKSYIAEEDTANSIQQLRQLLLKSQSADNLSSNSVLQQTIAPRSTKKLNFSILNNIDEDSPPRKHSKINIVTVDRSKDDYSFIPTEQELEELRSPYYRRAFTPMKDSRCLQIIMQAKAERAELMGISHIPQSMTKPEMVSAAKGKAYGINDFRLSMGRSFRVGWTPDGRIVHPGKFLFENEINSKYSFCHRFVVEKVNPLRWSNIRWPQDAHTVQLSLEKSLHSLLDVSIKSEQLVTHPSGKEEMLPHWRSPTVDIEQTKEYNGFLKFIRITTEQINNRKLPVDHPDWHCGKALELINAAFGQEKEFSGVATDKTVEIIPFFEDRSTVVPEIWERRREQLSRWLESIASAEGMNLYSMPLTNLTLFVNLKLDESDVEARRSSGTYDKIFHALSTHRIDQAVAIAEEASMFRLASILSQLDGDTSIPVLIRNQLELWQFTDGASTIPPELIKIYRLIGAVPIADHLKPTSILLGQGWIRTLGILLWYCSSCDSFTGGLGTMATTLDSYRLALKDQLVDEPLSSYIEDTDLLGADMKYPQVQDGLYSLLELLFPTQIVSTQDDIEEEGADLVAKNRLKIALLPQGYTKDLLDYRAVYFLLVALESAEIVNGSEVHCDIIRNSIVYQLLSMNCWHLAVFVLLQLKDPAKRFDAVHQIICRFGGEINWETINEGFGTESKNKFVVQSLGISQVLIHEATAYRCCYEHKHELEVSYLYYAELWDRARQVLCVQVAPKAILASSDSLDKILLLLESIEDKTNSSNSYGNDVWIKLSHALLSFLRLRDYITSSGENNDTINASEVFQESKSLLEKVLYLQKNPIVTNTTEKTNLILVVIYNIGSYLYSLLHKLETYETLTSDEISKSGHFDNGGGMLDEGPLLLLSEKLFKNGPVLQETLVDTLLEKTTRFMFSAASMIEGEAVGMTND